MLIIYQKRHTPHYWLLVEHIQYWLYVWIFRQRVLCLEICENVNSQFREAGNLPELAQTAPIYVIISDLYIQDRDVS